MLHIDDIAKQTYRVGAQKDIIPQANDLDKVIRLIHLVGEGVTNAHDIATEFGFANRQSSYYREAAEALGFVSFNGREYSLTSAGKLFVSLDTESRNLFMAQAVNEFSLFKMCIDVLQSEGSLNEHEIEKIIARVSNLSGSTIPRRAQSIKSWLRWIAAKTGAFVVEDNAFVVMTEK